MRTYDPKIKITLIKAVERKEIIPGIPVVQERYAGAAGYNLTPLLGENGVVRVDKSTREMAGAFSITLADPFGSGSSRASLLDSIYGLIEPMDLVEIRFCHDPSEYGGVPPVVMRGIVSTVQRGENLQGGKPHRQVTIAGQDWGKILGIIMIYYLNNSTLNEYHLSAYRFFQRYAGNSSPKLKSAAAFLSDVIANVINPFMKGITQFADGEPLGARVINEMTMFSTVRGMISPYVVSTFADTSLHAMLSSIFDVGAFNELYVSDMPDDIALVLRPNPFRKPKDKEFIQDGAWAEEIDIPDEDLVALSPVRTDGAVANYYWVSATRWALMDNMTMKELAMKGSPETFILKDYFNSDATFYGFRKLEVDSSMLPESFAPKAVAPIVPQYSASDSAKKDVLAKDEMSLHKWLDWRRDCLNKMNQDNAIFEQGTMVLRGNEKIKAGMYINLIRKNFVAPYYAFKVSHTFRPFQDFITTVNFDRGEGFIERSTVDKPHHQELNVKGA